MESGNLRVALFFFIPIVGANAVLNSNASGSNYNLVYWRNENRLLLYCETKVPLDHNAVFLINKTHSIYFADANVSLVHPVDILEVTAALPSLSLNIVKFDIKPELEGIYFCGNLEANDWSKGVGPFTAKPIIDLSQSDTIKTTNGNNVTMTCPVPLGKMKKFYDVQWIGNVSNNVIVNNTGKYSTLTIINVQDGDYKEYICKIAVNNPVDGRKWTKQAKFTLTHSPKYTSALIAIGFSWNIAGCFFCCLFCCCCCCRPSENDTKSQKVKKKDESGCVRKTSTFVLHNKHCIGRGAFGTVFLATYNGYTCAAKMLTHHAQCFATGIDARDSVQKEALKAFLKECKFLQSLSHENIVKHITTRFDERSNLPILVMELMDSNLKTYLKDNQPQVLPLFFQISLFVDISRGLEFLHSQNLYHRDICDDNILLIEKGDIPRAKISDFGMSKLIQPDHMSSSLTAVGNRRIYCPPEAVTYPIKYSHTIDVYALGVLGLQIILVDIQARNCNDLLAKLSVNHVLRNIIISCLDEDGVHRPSARDLVTMLTFLQ